MLDPRFTLLVPSLPPSEGRKQGPEHVPDHGGRILETQGECWSVLGQTGGWRGQARSGEVRRVSSSPWLVNGPAPGSSAYCAPHSRWPPVRGCQAKTLTASNPLEAGGCWRWRKVRGWTEDGWCGAACSCRRQLPSAHSAHTDVLGSLHYLQQLDIDNY